MAKELKDLNLIDNFLFGTLMMDNEGGMILGNEILETIFQRKFHKLKLHSEYPIFPGSPEFRGIRRKH